MPILFFPFDLLSHYLRCLQLAEAVSDRYEVVFLDSARYGHFVRARGFRTVAGTDLDADEVVRRTAAFRFDWLRHDDLEAVLHSQIALIEAEKPALVVGDMSHTLRMAAEYTGTPFVSVINGYMSPYYAVARAMPSVHPLLLHPPASRLVLDLLTPVGETITFWHIHRPYRTLRRALGLPMVYGYADEFVGDLTCIADSPVLFPQRQLPDSFAVIGPLYHRDDRPEPEVETFLARRPGRLTVVVNMGSTGGLERLLLLNDEMAFGHFNFIVAGDTQRLFSGPHIFSSPFLNLGVVLPGADVALCHGGNGAINQALAAGVPVLCLPAYFEQEWNAQRIDDLGLGQWLHRVPSAAALQRLLQRWSMLKGQLHFAKMPAELDVEPTKRRFRKAIQRFSQ